MSVFAKRHLALAGLVALLVGIAAEATAMPRQCRPVVNEVQTRIAIDLHMGDDMAMEAYAGRDLERYVASIAPACGRYVVGMLIHELQDPDDLVRLYAAEALGAIGPAARRAAPALMAALKLDKCWRLGDGICQKPSWSSTIAIRPALKSILGPSAGDLPIYNCDYSGGVLVRDN